MSIQCWNCKRKGAPLGLVLVPVLPRQVGEDHMRDAPPPPYETWGEYWADHAEDMYDRDWEER